MGRPRKSESRDTRQCILLTALDLFSREGYTATSMRCLALAVGVRESALYVHFKSKQHILQTLMETYGPERQAAALTDLALSGKSQPLAELVWDSLDQVIDRWSHPEEIKFYRLMVSESLRENSSFCEISRQYMQRFEQSMRTFFTRLLAESDLNHHDVEFVEMQFIGPMMFLRQRYLMFAQQPFDQDKFKSFAKKHIDFIFQNLLRSKT